MEIAVLMPSPAPPGGGSVFDAGLVQALIALGHSVTVGDGPGTPVVDGMMVPGLESRLDELVARDAVVLVHHASASAARDPAAREAQQAIEARMLRRMRRVVATSQPVANRLTEYGVAAPLVLHPGHPVLPRSRSVPGACAILSVGVLTPRKGHDRLLAALARLTDLGWTLVIAGDARRDPVHASTLLSRVEELGLQNRVKIEPGLEPGELRVLWETAGLFATATAWEGYPSALAEAMRRGIPIVAPRLPGIEAVASASAGVLYPADDAATFGKCLRRAIFDAGLRAELAEGAWLAGCALPDWAQQARAFETILRG